METNKKKPVYSIQVMRGIAAVAVMLLHHNPFIAIPSGSFFAKVIPGASWGVDLFFMISGFIAAYTVNINASGHLAGMNYIARRFIRIIPLYYILTILSFGSDKTAWINSMKSLLFIPIGGAAGPAYGGAQIGQGWTLNYEIYFYLIVTASFLFGRLKWYFVFFAISGSVIFAYMLSAPHSSYLINGPSFSVAYLSLITHPIIFEFLFGVAVGLYYPRLSTQLKPLQLSLCIAGIVFFVYNAVTQRWVGHGLQGWGFPSAILLCAALKLEKCGFTLKNRHLLLLGTYSYSIYLLHENIKNILIKLSKHMDKTFHMPDLLILLLSIITTLLLSALTYKLIEVKLANWLKAKFNISPSMPV